MKRSIKHYRISLVIAVALAWLAPSKPSAAADPDTSGSRANVLLEEVLVTARKRDVAESAQDVPITITAFSGEQIDKTFVKDLVEVGHLVPNAELHPSSFPGYSNFVVRGLGSAGTVVSDEPAVGVFIDGMYLGTNAGMVVDIFDLDAIEVLRGPQSTLFGRNVTGGAVQLRTRRPAGNFDYGAQATLGSFNDREFAGSIEGPLASGKIAPKLAASYIDHDGYYQNKVHPGDDGRIGWEETYTARPSVLLTPTDNVDIYLL